MSEVQTEKLEVQELVAKETHELMLGLEGVVEAVRVALADGWQAGQDLPAIVVGSIAHLAPAVQGVEKLPDEAKGDLEGFTTALMLGVKRIVFKFLKK